MQCRTENWAAITVAAADTNGAHGLPEWEPKFVLVSVVTEHNHHREDKLMPCKWDSVYSQHTLVGITLYIVQAVSLSFVDAVLRVRNAEMLKQQQQAMLAYLLMSLGQSELSRRPVYHLKQ